VVTLLKDIPDKIRDMNLGSLLFYKTHFGRKDTFFCFTKELPTENRIRRQLRRQRKLVCPQRVSPLLVSLWVSLLLC
jgi:hypothetical protein